MPRESEKRAITRWLLSRLEKDAQRILQKRQVQQLRRIFKRLFRGRGSRQEVNEDCFLDEAFLDEFADSNQEYHTRRQKRILASLKMIESIGRYMEPRDRIPKSLNWSETIINQLSPHRFRHFFRMNSDSVYFILSKIENHVVFYNNSRNPQVESLKQLLVALRRLACEGGTDAAVLSVSQMFGIGEGTVTLYTKRVVKALSQLQNQVVTWPTIEEKVHMKRRLRNAGNSSLLPVSYLE